MPALNFASPVSWNSLLRIPPLRPLATLVRTTEARLRPPRISPHRSALAPDHPGSAAPGTRTTILKDAGRGPVPTIVLGGFVPDAAEQVFLLRQFLTQAGDVYYFHYPRDGFAMAALEQQLDELIAELNVRKQTPVLVSVSFGAGLALEWLRRSRAAGRSPRIGGLILVSPVACTADLITPGAVRATTLLGRALQPYLDEARPPSAAVVEKSRTIFTRMFEAGAQNKSALQGLMSAQEAERLRSAVLSTIQGISVPGACERVRALTAMRPLPELFAPALLPLTTAPTLVLYAQREELVLAEQSPTRFALEGAHRAYFTRSRVRLVQSGFGQPPVQHASLIFHVFDFLPHFESFYRDVRNPRLPLAA